jgi:hypothetical protein
MGLHGLYRDIFTFYLIIIIIIIIDQVKEDDMGRACSTIGGEEDCI